MEELIEHKDPIANRFRGFLPVVVDVETAGFEYIYAEWTPRAGDCFVVMR